MERVDEPRSTWSRKGEDVRDREVEYGMPLTTFQKRNSKRRLRALLVISIVVSGYGGIIYLLYYLFTTDPLGKIINEILNTRYGALIVLIVLLIFLPVVVTLYYLRSLNGKRTHEN